MTWPPFLLAAIVALALVVWAAFYLLGSPLNPAEAVVVVGLCGVIAYGVRAAVLRLLHSNRKKALPGHHAQAELERHRPTKARAKTTAARSRPRKRRRH